MIKLIAFDLDGTFLDDDHLVGLVAHVVDQDAALRHTVLQVAVDEDREGLAVARLEA